MMCGFSKSKTDKKKYLTSCSDNPDAYRSVTTEEAPQPQMMLTHQPVLGSALGPMVRDEQHRATNSNQPSNPPVQKGISDAVSSGGNSFSLTGKSSGDEMEMDFTRKKTYENSKGEANLLYNATPKNPGWKEDSLALPSPHFVDRRIPGKLPMKNDPNYKTLIDMPDWDADDQHFEEPSTKHATEETQCCSISNSKLRRTLSLKFF